MKISLMADPEYREAYEKLQSLNGELKETERQIDKLHRRIQDDKAPDFLTDEAERFLQGEKANTKSTTLRDQVLELYHKRTVMNRAISIQRERLGKITQRVSGEICKEIRPKYAAAVKNVAELVKKLDAAKAEERIIREAMLDGGLVFMHHIPPVVLKGIGELREPYSHASQFLKEAQEAKYI